MPPRILKGRIQSPLIISAECENFQIDTCPEDNHSNKSTTCKWFEKSENNIVFRVYSIDVIYLGDFIN